MSEKKTPKTKAAARAAADSNPKAKAAAPTPEAASDAADAAQPEAPTEATEAADAHRKVAEPAPAAANDGRPEPDPHDDHIASLEAEIGDLKDKLLRALAEVENVRRRAQKEVGDSAKYGPSSLARELFPVADNLRRALDAVPAEAREDSESIKNLLIGVEMTEKELLAAFERSGIKRIDPAGEKFDHNFHQAMMEVPTNDQPPGTVVQVMQVGYVLHDRLLRPAMVGVAKAADATKPGEDKGSQLDTTA